jgi:hypothetical protein
MNTINHRVSAFSIPAPEKHVSAEMARSDADLYYAACCFPRQ